MFYYEHPELADREAGQVLTLSASEPGKRKRESLPRFKKTVDRKAKNTMRRVCFLGFCLSLLICSAASLAGSARAQAEASRLPPTEAERIIARCAKQVLLALKSRDIAKLSEHVHPRKGLRFSPYHSVNPAKDGDRVFTRRQIESLLAGKKRYLWGAEDGSGDPIRLTFAAYLRKFVYDHDYLSEAGYLQQR